MTLAQRLLDALGYRNSPNFLGSGRYDSFEDASDFSHIFRRAREHCRLQGVYSLRQSEAKGRDIVVPIVYVCEADGEADAERIHRLVWNQNVVPFLIVTSQRSIRLYSGFRYETSGPDTASTEAGVLKAAGDMDAAMHFLDSFHSSRIDDGTLWEQWGHEVTPETRVDWKLLSSLNDLDIWLRNNGIDDPHVSHSLIGKFVYLQYLRHRGILSDRKLEKWGLKANQIFSRDVQLSAFWKVVEELDRWLNGSVFPLVKSGPLRPKIEHIRKVAGTFAGDDPVSGQLSLDFDAYDFSFIPIEALSVIYEQFLHAPNDDGGITRGRTQGAYYTPISVVNFMLEELDAEHPFHEGMRVLDPACGSGAFLVQCYRRIVEQDDEFVPGKPMRPSRLRELLESHIYGIDRDQDACRVAELSLSLTLLDYVDPPDLERTPRFRLPKLDGNNIFHGDFFDEGADWRKSLESIAFDWIVGNPPWVELKRGKISKQEEAVWRWMQSAGNQEERPVGGNQIAEAFAWEAPKYLKSQGRAALLLPAMTLFKDESKSFRQRFFSGHHVHSVANFSNLSYVLFPGHRYSLGRRTTVTRSQRAAAAFFYSRNMPDSLERIDVFAPFVAEQPANRPTLPAKRKDTWNIVVDASQIRTVEMPSILNGEALPWKTAMWGSSLDLRLLRSLETEFPSFLEFSELNELTVARGFELTTSTNSAISEPAPELIGKPELDMSKLKDCGLMFEFPEEYLRAITEERANLRRRGGRIGLEVSRPPHIILDRSRRFAIYSEEFVALSGKLIGIAAQRSKNSMLKALSLYLVSDFAIYHQFLSSPEWGVSTSIATLDALRSLPVPLSKLTQPKLREWLDLHNRLVRSERRRRESRQDLFSGITSASDNVHGLLNELNDRVFDLLELTDEEQSLVSDLVHVRMKLVKGKVSPDAVRDASVKELRDYGDVLLGELDTFVGNRSGYSHSVAILENGKAAIVAIELKTGRTRAPQRVVVKKDPAMLPKGFMEIHRRVERENSQWIYFRRNLRLYEGRNTYIYKPIERLYWTKSQAVLDASSVIAETLS